MNIEKYKNFRLLCKVDKKIAILEYNEEENIGISLVGFESDKLKKKDEYIRLFNLEVSFQTWNNIKSSYGNNHALENLEEFINDNCFALITLEYNKNSQDYVYATYSTEEPRRVEIKKISFQYYKRPNYLSLMPINNRDLALPFITQTVSTNNLIQEYTHTGNFHLIPYSVGQGMCSLLHNNDVGYLLDAGAGKPVLRKDYLEKKYKNQIVTDISDLKEVYLILSHLDSDHFRLIRWDSEILNKIKKIYIPSRLPWIDSKDKSIAEKVDPIDKLQVKSRNLILKCYRTSHSKDSNKKNDNELITFIKINNHSVLYPGDYIYSNISSDKNSNISKLANKSYEFICAPHHGDKESQHCIPLPASKSSLVYFSAGNHLSWNHPNNASVVAHKNIGYNTNTFRDSKDIQSITLYDAYKPNHAIKQKRILK